MSPRSPAGWLNEGVECLDRIKRLLDQLDGRGSQSALVGEVQILKKRVFEGEAFLKDDPVKLEELKLMRQRLEGGLTSSQSRIYQ